MASFSSDFVLDNTVSVLFNLILTMSRWTLVADSRWDATACRWIYKNKWISYYIASLNHLLDFISLNVSSRESLSDFGQILREIFGYIFKQMKVDSGTMSISAVYIWNMDFYMKFWKPKEGEFLFFAVLFSWFRSKSLKLKITAIFHWQPLCRNFQHDTKQ